MNAEIQFAQRNAPKSFPFAAHAMLKQKLRFEFISIRDDVNEEFSKLIPFASFLSYFRSMNIFSIPFDFMQFLCRS